MKKKIIGLTVLAILLSGCSVGTLNKSNNTGTSSGVGETDAFSTKALPGSLWKTEDGGKTFVVKSKVSEQSSITKADILSIAYHPTIPMTLYVSSVENGIFKTENGGDTWTPIPFPPKKIYSFILDKNDPDNRMFASGIVDNWGKIFRTDDGGVTWRDVYTEPGQNTPITALSQHFRDRNILFAGTATGTVVKSTDSGETWRNIGNKIDGLVADIAFDVEKGNVVYLLLFSNKLYYSSDGGAKWLDWEDEKRSEVQALQEKAGKASSDGNTNLAESLGKQISKLNERNQKNQMPGNIISVMTDPTISGVIYAGTNHGLYRSTDFGKYWTEFNIIESAKKFPIRSIAVNPKNPKEIVFVAGKAFYKSIDDGVTWMTTGLNVDRGASFVTYDPFDPRYLFMGLRNFK